MEKYFKSFIMLTFSMFYTWWMNSCQRMHHRCWYEWRRLVLWVERVRICNGLLFKSHGQKPILIDSHRFFSVYSKNVPVKWKHYQLNYTTFDRHGFYIPTNLIGSLTHAHPTKFNVLKRWHLMEFANWKKAVMLITGCCWMWTRGFFPNRLARYCLDM